MIKKAKSRKTVKKKYTKFGMKKGKRRKNKWMKWIIKWYDVGGALECNTKSLHFAWYSKILVDEVDKITIKCAKDSINEFSITKIAN